MQLPTDETVRVGTILAMPVVLQSLGADPADVLADLGLDSTLFENPDNRLSYATRGRLFDRCVARTGCRHVGLLIGQRNGLHAFGLVGALMKHAPDVGTALRSLVSYMHVNVRGAETSLIVEGEFALLGYKVCLPRVPAVEQVCDGVVATAMTIMRDLCGRDWKPHEVWFAHRRPENDRPFTRYFQAPLRFDAELSGLVFPARLLDDPLPGNEPELGHLLQAQIKELEARLVDEFPEQIRTVLRTAVLMDHSSADQVAALFSIQTRTLNRRLQAFGTNFRELVDQVRFEIARQMLENTAMEVQQIADSLGYARASALTLAFRRWSGTTPTAWRAKHLSAAQLPSA